MLVNDILSDIEAKFPKFRRGAWEKEFHALLGPCEGERLREGWDITIRSWRQARPPMAGDIARNVPGRHAGGDGTGSAAYRKRLEDRDVERRRIARETTELGFRDFRERYGRQDWEWQVWQRISRLADEYAQAVQLKNAGRLSEQGFAKYRYKLTDAEIETARKCWESQRGFRNGLANPVQQSSA
jgi:hypothetical protein